MPEFSIQLSGIEFFGRDQSPGKAAECGSRGPGCCSRRDKHRGFRRSHGNFQFCQSPDGTGRPKCAGEKRRRAHGRATESRRAGALSPLRHEPRRHAVRKEAWSQPVIEAAPGCCAEGPRSLRACGPGASGGHCVASPGLQEAGTAKGRRRNACLDQLGCRVAYAATATWRLEATTASTLAVALAKAAVTASAPMPTPSMRMTSTSVMPTKPSTLRR